MNYSVWFEKRIDLFILLFLLIIYTACSSKKDPDSSVQSVSPVAKINGVWIAAPQHNDLMHSPQKIHLGVRRLHDLGINTLFLCVWADNKTAYPSNVLLANSHYKSLDSTSFMSNYETQSGLDLIEILIQEAHELDMKVVFWFEYGMMAQVGSKPNLETHPILSIRPEWLGINNEGKSTNYNQTDFYFNSFHPQVQQFMLDMIAEALEKYPAVDGVQGDDRLPASPANSGYDDWTLKAYQDFSGHEPPWDFREEKWFRWRIELLNKFAAKMYQMVKSKNENYLIAFSPNPYPWCAENLMQDWPNWIEKGYVEMLNVQCYRRDFKAYESTVNQAWSFAASDLQKNQFVPGVLLGVSNEALVTPNVLDSILEYNQSQGFGGQSYFYLKWVIESEIFHEPFKRHHEE